MLVKLPIPIYTNNEVFSTSLEIRKPNAGCIADTKKISDTGDHYGAINFFIASCTESIETKTGMVTDRSVIKNSVRNMPYRSAEYVFTQIMLLRHSDDGVEGIYFCPRCKTQIICEAKKDRQTGEMLSDTRDFISNLHVNFTEDLVNIEHHFQTPIEIKSMDGRLLSTREGVILEPIESFIMRHPTLADAMMGVKRADKSDDLRGQFGIYVECLVEVNGKLIDYSWKNNFGMTMFERADLDTDIIEISNKVNEYGMEKRILRTCPSCGKEWRSIVNTSNFFDLEAPHM